MTYDSILARTPPSTAAGHTAIAAEFVVFLTTQIEGDRATFTQFSPSQQKYLHRLREKWRIRAAGNDTRWNTCGSRPGRLASSKTKKPRTHRRPDPGEETPLFQSLMRKYGTPRND